MRSPSLPLLALALILGACAAAPGERSLTIYGGRYVDSSLPEEILLLRPLDYEDSYLVALAVASPFAKPAQTNQWEIEGQLAKHFGDQDHWEINSAVLWRWKAFPWNRYLPTSAALGTGLSFATKVPALEQARHPDTGSRQLLNYWVIEATLAPPGVDSWSFVFRIHHRSGVFGLFDGVDGGSNIMSGGIKFFF